MIAAPKTGLHTILRQGDQAHGVLESVCRILWTMWLIPYGSFHELCFVDPTSWCMAALMMLLFYELKIKKALTARQREELAGFSTQA